MRLFASACAAVAVMASSREGLAWYFPEHVEIAHDALSQLRPEVREVLRDAIRRARGEGLALCEHVDASLEEVARRAPLETRMVRSQVRVECVPYAAIGALAGDHASSVPELRAVLGSTKAIEITSAVAYEWSRFQDALRGLPNTSIERMSFVHELDVVFYFIDPGYELRAQASRAHFVDAGRPIDVAVHDAARTGSVDDALGQFLAHHLRSLELATRGQVSEALLENAFALHFLEDAFAAGHLVMTPEVWRSGNDLARARHDYFDARGLPVVRAMGVEPCATLGEEPLEAGLAPCWVTSGDGYLGLSADASDRAHAARAVRKVELELALALDAAHVVAAIEGLGEREQLALGELVEPAPWWTVKRSERPRLRATAARTLALVHAEVVALERVHASAAMGAVAVGSPPEPGRFPAAWLEGAMGPCEPRANVDPSLADVDGAPPCGPAEVLALGTPGVSLLRPLLAEWPASQVDPSELHGEAKLDHGWALQLLAAADASMLIPPHAPVDLLAPSLGVSAGLSYRWGDYLPGRLNRPIAEMNVGLSEALHYDNTGHSGGNLYLTLFDQELRWPIFWELLTSYRLPLDLVEGHAAGRALLLSGVRVHEVIGNPRPAFLGLELEVLAVALSRGHGAYPLYATSPELRLYVGAADPAATQPSLPHAWGPMVSIALTGGYATLL
ncbi:MAG TPA: hypothetical protein VHS09_16765 [Polyangiaceae bacterium]|nr:hypothetical protein [Polyangiaceae bacterium]